MVPCLFLSWCQRDVVGVELAVKRAWWHGGRGSSAHGEEEFFFPFSYFNTNRSFHEETFMAYSFAI